MDTKPIIPPAYVVTTSENTTAVDGYRCFSAAIEDADHAAGHHSKDAFIYALIAKLPASTRKLESVKQQGPISLAIHQHPEFVALSEALAKAHAECRVLKGQVEALKGIREKIRMYANAQSTALGEVEGFEPF